MEKIACTKNNFWTRSILNNSILKFTQRQLNKIHFHRSRVQEIVQKQETLNAIECQWKRQQPRAKAKALAYRDRLRYITSIVYFHSSRTGKYSQRIGTRSNSCRGRQSKRMHSTDDMQHKSIWRNREHIETYA